MSHYRAYKDLGNDLDQSTQNSYKCEVITTHEQKQRILQNNSIVVIDIYGDWCQPCQVISPVFEKMAEEYNGKYPGKVYLCKEDVDSGLSPNCTGVPMFVFSINGVNVKNIMGGDMAQVKESLDDFVASMVSQNTTN